MIVHLDAFFRFGRSSGKYHALKSFDVLLCFRCTLLHNDVFVFTRCDSASTFLAPMTLGGGIHTGPELPFRDNCCTGNDVTAEKPRLDGPSVALPNGPSRTRRRTIRTRSSSRRRQTCGGQCNERAATGHVVPSSLPYRLNDYRIWRWSGRQQQKDEGFFRLHQGGAVAQRQQQEESVIGFTVVIPHVFGRWFLRLYKHQLQ
jgi:hypothetical protein